jgi:hypothetical protein
MKNRLLIEVAGIICVMLFGIILVLERHRIEEFSLFRILTVKVLPEIPTIKQERIAKPEVGVQPEQKTHPHKKKIATVVPSAQTNSAPNGIAIGGGTVINPTVNNFGESEPDLHWTQKQAPTGSSVTVTLWVEHSLEYPAFAAECDHPCVAIGAESDGPVQAAFGGLPGKPNISALLLNLPRPLGAWVKIDWSIKSKDGQELHINAITKLRPSQVHGNAN